MGPSAAATPSTTTATTTAAASERGPQLCRSSSGCSKPSWLRAALADVEQRYQTLSLHRHNQGDGMSSVSESDSFADRAENYYQKRPQLLSLLHDLYHRYLSLADRYTQALLRSSAHNSSHSHSNNQHGGADLDDAATVVTDLTDPDPDYPQYSSDSESSFCFSHHNHHQGKATTAAAAAAGPQHILDNSPAIDFLVADLVTKLVDNHLLRQFCADLDRRVAEAARRAELQGSLVDVLESERAVLVAENARLAARADSAEAEREALAAESAYLRRRASELARAAAGLKEDRRACALGRRIEALQAQVYGLERRNREIVEAMGRREEEKTVVVRAVCRELERVRAENARLRAVAEAKRGMVDGIAAAGKRRKTTGSSAKGWWGRGIARSLEGWVLCGSNAGRSKEEMSC